MRVSRRQVKPLLGSAAEGKCWQVRILLERDDDGPVRVSVHVGDEVFGSESVATLPGAVLRGQEIFREGFQQGVRREVLRAELDSREAGLVQLGHALRELCLPGNATAALAELLDGSPAGTTVEVVFESDDTRLLGLPFEALRLEDGRLLVVHPKVILLRRPAGLKATPAAALAGPLKILVAVGAPDEDRTPNVVLDQERELQNILDAVDAARRYENAEVRILEVGSPAQIGEALERDAFHVLHLSCHGGPGVLELEDEDGGALRVSAQELLAPILAQGRPLPMVFLNSCHGAARAGEAASLAEELLRAGIPAVLAMLTSVTDVYATRLAGRFYEHLARRDAPRPSRALAAARRELEEARQKELAAGTAGPEQRHSEVATATLLVAGDDAPLLDPSLDREGLKTRPVYAVSGPVPQLRIDDLIGRRRELRTTLRVLRAKERRFAGVVLTGIGGVGKSALAGRVMQRLEEDGWLVVAHLGRVTLETMTSLIGQGLLLKGRPDQLKLAKVLVDVQIDERQRFALAARTLAQEQILLVLDDFEQNLTPDGSAFLNPDVPVVLAELLQNAHHSRMLVTCRHPLPGFAAELCEVAIGPLSDAESRKLLLRLESLRGKEAGEIQKVLRLLGGHPRMLELLDALLRGGEGRLPLVTKKLQKLLAEGEVAADNLAEGLKQTVLLGSRDVLLAELLATAREAGHDEALLQLAVSNLPVSAAGLARMAADPGTAEGLDVAAAEQALAYLARLSLVFRHPDGKAWVHRWTAEGLAGLSEESSHQRRCHHAAIYRLWRAQNESHDLGEAIEGMRNFLAGKYWDEGAAVARKCIELLRHFQQSTGIAALAAEVLESLPIASGDYAFIADQEAQAHLALGWTARAMERYQALLALYQQRTQAEPQRAIYQQTLAAFYERMGDLYVALGEGEKARQAFEESLEIRQRLEASEPQRAGYQQDLWVSYSKMGNLYLALGEGEKARQAFEKSLELSQRLAASEPQRADYQRDLSVSYGKMGDLYVALGEGEKARQAFEKSLEIFQRLAAAEPQRADYQRDLSVSYERIGDLYVALGEGEKARQAFEKNLEIAQRLAAAEPERADYQADLAISWERIGALQMSMGNGHEAHQAFSRELAICERLVAAVPERADYQVQIWVPLTRLGLLEGQDGRAKIERALALVERLHAEGRLAPSKVGMIEAARQLLAHLDRRGAGEQVVGD